MVYLKAIAILLVVWRLLTIGAFGQVVSGILAATLAFLLTRQSNSIPKQVRLVQILAFRNGSSRGLGGTECRALCSICAALLGPARQCLNFTCSIIVAASGLLRKRLSSCRSRTLRRRSTT